MMWEEIHHSTLGYACEKLSICDEKSSKQRTQSTEISVSLPLITYATTIPLSAQMLADLGVVHPGNMNAKCADWFLCFL